MKLFVDNSGIINVFIPITWKYHLIDNKVHTFQNYEKWKCETFQVSIKKVSQEESTLIEKNRNGVNVKMLGDNKCYYHPDIISDKFTTKLWTSFINGHSVTFTFTFDPKLLKGRKLRKELKVIWNVISSFKVISENGRESNLKSYRFSMFMQGTGATLAILDNAVKNNAFIEATCILANLIDGLLRISIVLKKQIINNNSEIEQEWIYQGNDDRRKTEKDIYKKSLELGIIDNDINNKLYKLYEDRNRVVHRFIFCEITIAEIEEIAYKYYRIQEQVSSIVEKLEEEQIKIGVGMTKTVKVEKVKKTKSNFENPSTLNEFVKGKIGKRNY